MGTREQRKCRQCGGKYLIPSEWVGCCSEKCRLRRDEVLLAKVQKKELLFEIKDNPVWLRLRYEAFRKYGNKCCLCGSYQELHVDHIKPRHKYPHLTFDINNLQILCKSCNYGKGAKYSDDWREKSNEKMDQDSKH